MLRSSLPDQPVVDALCVFFGRSGAVPIKRYYRRELESDDDKGKISSDSSSASSGEGRGRRSNQRQSSYGRRGGATLTEPDGKRR